MDAKREPPPPYDTSGHFNSGYSAPPGDLYGNVSLPAVANSPGQAPSQNPPFHQYQGMANVVVTQPVYMPAHVNSVPDNMNLAIFATFCCCWPLGVIAMFRATESRNALARNDVNAALAYAQESRRYSNLAIFGGIAMWIICVIVIVVLLAVVLRI